MKLSSRNKVSRRSLIQAIGGSALLLPGLELFGKAQAQAAGRQAKYAVFCYVPDGVNQNDFWPSGNGRNFELNKIMNSFKGLEDKMLLLGSQGNNSGLKYIAPTPQHQPAVTTTARVGEGCSPGKDNCYRQPEGLPYAKDQTKANNDIDGPSIDQVIANSIAGDSLFRSLEFGMHPIGGDTPSDINYAMDGKAIKRMSSADEAFKRVFGSPVAQVGQQLALNKAKALTDFLHGNFQGLRPALSSHDRNVLDAHLTSLSTLETRRLQQLQNAGSSCSGPEAASVPMPPNRDRNTGADTEVMTPFFMDTITSAFSCGLTKVASLTFGYPGGGSSGGLRFPWLNIRGDKPLHQISHHGGNGTTLNEYTMMHAWIGEQISRLMRNLAEVNDPDGVPILDNTVIYWFNRHGDGNSHSNHSLPNVILGGTGGYFDMGRYLKLPDTNPTEVLISLANSFGIDLPSFGQQKYRATQALGGLSA